ncbi:MAG TPA: PEP/pyruvate-binding domain-containing protein [Pseudonocardia sp.]
MTGSAGGSPEGPWTVELDAGEQPAALVGGKGHGLMALSAAGLRVPPGFVVTTAAYRRAVAGGLDRRIERRLAELPPQAPLDAVEEAAAEVRALLVAATEGHPATAAVADAFARLGERCGSGAGGPEGDEVCVAVRSSSAAEDAADRSFAGEHDTYLWVRGVDEVQRRVRECWASLFTARAIAYRAGGAAPAAGPDAAPDAAPDAMAVVVQQMVPARAAGVFMTLNPSNGDRSKVVVESVWGLGEPLVSGLVNPDRFTVDKVTGDVVRREVADKPTEAVRDPDAGRGVVTVAVDEDRRSAPSLDRDELAELTRLAKLLERRAGCPQDGEFAVAAGTAPRAVHLVQARPETVWSRRPIRRVATRTGMDAILATLTGATQVEKTARRPEREAT